MPWTPETPRRVHALRCPLAGGQRVLAPWHHRKVVDRCTQHVQIVEQAQSQPNRESS